MKRKKKDRKVDSTLNARERRLRMNAKETSHLLKNRFRQLESGKCKVVSKGDDCDCNLCLVDNLLSYILSSEEKMEEMKEKHKIDLEVQYIKGGAAQLVLAAEVVEELRESVKELKKELKKE